MSELFYDRLKQMNAAQREALSRRLDELGVPTETETTRRDLNLVAYVVRAPGHTVTAAGLRGKLKEALPAYLIPSDFHVVDSLPRLPNGKFDASALAKAHSDSIPDSRQELDDKASQQPPALLSVNESESGSRPATDDDTTPSNTPSLDKMREMLIEIWKQVLARDEVTINDNFFDLGGHSVLATLVVSRIHQILDTDLPLRALFEKPTIAELSLLLIEEMSSSSKKSGEKNDDEPQLVARPRRSRKE